MFLGYIRQSREKDSDISPETQREAIAHWASAPGKDHKVRYLPPDRDESGKDLGRPSMQEALGLLRAGKAQGIVVAKLDRLTRSIRDLANLIEESRRDGWTIICLDLGGETVDFGTKTGKMMGYLTGMFSEWYLDGVTEEWAKVRRHKIGLGHHWGQPPLGYRRGTVLNAKGIEQPGALVVDEKWAPVVAEVFRRRALSNGSRASWRELTAYLNGEGAPARRERSKAAQEERTENGSRWSQSMVASIVSNRAYRGEARAGELHNPAAHPALVDEDLYRRANRPGRNVAGKTRGAGPMLGKGFLRCHCGATLYLVPGGLKADGSRYGYYRCREADCTGCSIAQTKAEGYAVEKLLARLREVEPLRVLEGGNPELDRLNGRIAELDAEEAEIEADLEISRVEKARARTEITTEREGLVEALTEAGEQEEATVRAVPAAVLEATLPELAGWEIGNIIRAVFTKCTVASAGGSRTMPVEQRMEFVARG